MYDLETERVAEEITRRGVKKVLIQLPDGLRPKAFTLAENLDRLTDAEILLSGDSCYGSCDVALNQAEAIGADLIVHYGHSRMMEDNDTPILYIEAKMVVAIAGLRGVAGNVFLFTFYPEIDPRALEIQSGTIRRSEFPPLYELCTEQFGKESLRLLQVTANQMEVMVSILHGIPPFGHSGQS